MDEQFETKDGVKVEIGDNLLKGIRALLKLVDNVNVIYRGRDQQIMSPGKEIHKAFGINITKMHKDYLKNKKHSVCN